MDSVRRGQMKLQSVSGDIRIAVAAGAHLWMDVSSTSGETVSELDALDGASGERAVDLRVEARSASGDIRLTRAAGVTSV